MSLIKDEDLINRFAKDLKEGKITEDQLYNLVDKGFISLPEYLQIIKLSK